MTFFRFAVTFAFTSALIFPSTASANDGDNAKMIDAVDKESVRLMKAGEDEKALIEIEKGLKIPHGPVLEKRKADCLLNLGRLKEALVVAKQAQKLDPNNLEVHQTLAQIYSEMNMQTEALKELQIAISKNPSDRGFRSSREKIYEHLHEWSKAAEDLTIVINTAEPKNRAKPLERRANCYMLLKDYPKAITDLTGALGSSVGRSDLMRMRAEAYEKMGNHIAAEKDMKAADTTDGDFEPPNTMGHRK